MDKIKKMLENLEKELRANKQYSAADKLLPIIEETKKDGWIPCSERMPEDESVPYWTTHEDGSIVMHWYSKECGFTFNWEVDDLKKRKRQGRVIAWTPILLPEPYKGE